MKPYPPKPRPRVAGTGAAAGLALLAALCAAPASASDNRLQNPGFDTALAAWVDMGDSARRSRFAGEDATGQSTSGSIELRQFGTVFANITERFRAQCVRLDGMVLPIAYGASARVDLAQAPPVRAQLLVWEHNDPNCQGAPLSGLPSTLVNDAEDAWRTVALTYVPSGPGVLAVQVELAMEFLQGGSGSGLRGVVRFDDVFFGGGPGRQPQGHVQRRATIDAGGGLSAQAGYAAHGSLGQPDAGSAAGAGYVLQSGFWHGRAEQPPAQTPIFANGFE